MLFLQLFLAQFELFFIPFSDEHPTLTRSHRLYNIFMIPSKKHAIWLLIVVTRNFRLFYQLIQLELIVITPREALSQWEKNENIKFTTNQHNCTEIAEIFSAVFDEGDSDVGEGRVLRF